MKSLAKNVEWRRIAPNASAATTMTLSAATTNVNSASVDSFGFDGVTFVAVLGALTATATIAFSVEGSVDGSGGWTAISGAAYASTADSDDDKLVVLEAKNLQYRYVRLATVRGTANSVLDGLIAVLSGAANVPVSQGATVEALASG